MKSSFLVAIAMCLAAGALLTFAPEQHEINIHQEALSHQGQTFTMLHSLAALKA